ncbi:hypothetical protein AKO1_015498, partial [Acrasis kona]
MAKQTILDYITHRRIRIVDAKFPDSLPPEKEGSIIQGLCAHLLPMLVYLLLIQYNTQTPLMSFGLGVTVMLLWLIIILYYEQMEPAADLPSLSFADVWRGAILLFVTGVITGCLVVYLSYQCGLMVEKAIGGFSKSKRSFDWWFIAFAALFDDFIYYCYHRFLSHQIKSWASFFQKIHLPHHAVVCLDFWRGNLSTVWDTAVFGFQLSFGFISVIYGMNLEATLVSYFLVLMFQATHHANHTFNIGRLRYFLVDNHAHKLHHCPWGSHINFGACFSCWDLCLGTFYENWEIGTNYAQLHKIPLNVRPMSRNLDKGTVFTLSLLVFFF